MAITFYSTQELIIVQQRLADLPDGFWRDMATRTITSDREEILFEKADVDNRKLAPFVAPNMQGRVMRGQGFSAQSFRPAYVKPKHVVDPTKAISRMMGEPFLGGMSMEARFNAQVVNNLRLEREAIERRWDWMASKAIQDGQVTVAGDDYPSVTVSFGRDPQLTSQLTGTARWSQTTTADPLADLARLNDLCFTLGNAPITRFIFGATAWGNFIKSQKVLDLLDATRRVGSSEFPVIPLVSNSNSQSMGSIITTGGRFDLYRYSNWYSDVDSFNGALTTRQFLDPNVVVGVGPGLDMVAMFGAIMDADANFSVEQPIFPKMWKNADPSVVYTMSQSAPLFVPLNPNNSFKLFTE